MTTLGSWLKGEGFTVDDSDVPLGRESEWHGVSHVLVHHTVSDDDGSEKSIADYCKHGGSGTYPPLCQIMLGQSGKLWMCCKERSGQKDPGRASHAGSGNGYGVPVDSMNAYSLGIECQCDGSHKLATHPTLYSTLIQLCAALCRRYDVPVDNVIGHKEWSSTGKVDPKDSMDTIRADVADALGQGAHVTRDVYRSKCGYGEPTNGDASSDTVLELQALLGIPATGRYDDQTDIAVRGWQQTIGDTPDQPRLSYLGPLQFEAMFPTGTYTRHDDGDPAIANTEEPPVTTQPPDGVTEGIGFWDWYSGKKTNKVLVAPDGNFHDIDLPAQPASGITSNSKEEHFLYLRVHLPAGRSATRTIHTRFVRSDGDETAYLSLSYDASKGNDSIAIPNYHPESGSGLGGRWQIMVEGGTDPIDYTTRYAKAYVTYRKAS